MRRGRERGVLGEELELELRRVGGPYLDKNRNNSKTKEDRKMQIVWFDR